MIPSYSPNEEKDKKTIFSINRALHHLKNISTKPHSVGTEEHTNVRKYLFKELEKLGLNPELQVKTVFNKKWKAGTTIENVIAKIEGSSSSKSLLVLSHYDSNPHSAVGASDAGSGIVTILEGITAFIAKGKKPKNDIIIVFSDAEELGLLGAEAFVNHHPLAKNIGLVLNFEARGSGGPSYMLMETNGKNGKLINEFLKANPKYPAANSLMYSVYKKLPNDTDLTVFRESANINGFNFAFIGDHFDYHTEQDNYDRLDRASLAHQKDYLISTLNYFSDADISDLNSTKDYVYVNFPFVSLLTFPFSYILPLLVTAFLFFALVIFIGIRKKEITFSGVFKGFIPFFIALVSSSLISFFLWKFLTIIHPQYKDILHGFTYNGYYYIAAFVTLTLWISFKTYNLFKNNRPLDLLIAPIFIWLLINILIYIYLPGASFFIIPVFIALLAVSIIFFKEYKHTYSALFTFISVPTIYMFSPLIKMFPVGLGLKNLFISSIFVVLVIGLLIPAFQEYKKKNSWQYLFGFLSILLFVIASIKSGVSINKKKPNSLVYIQNSEDKTALWATYNKTLDNYTKQIFNTDFSKGSISDAETLSKYNTKFNYYKKAPFKDVKNSDIIVSIDTIIGEQREICFTIKPFRKISKYELFSKNKLTVSYATVNSTTIYDSVKVLKNETLFVYHMSNRDKELKVSLTFNKNEQPRIILNEISNDLLTHPKFKLQPRSENMIPMPFVTNDAIISSKILNF